MPQDDDDDTVNRLTVLLSGGVMLCSSPVVTEQQERDGPSGSRPPRQPASAPRRQPASAPRRPPGSTPAHQPASSPPRQPASSPPRQPASTPPRQAASAPPQAASTPAEEREAEHSFPSLPEQYHDRSPLPTPGAVHRGIDELRAYIDARLSTTERQNQELVNLVQRQNQELQKITERQTIMERQNQQLMQEIEKQGTVQAELNRKLDVLMQHIMSSSQPRNEEALDEQHSSIGEPRVDARRGDEPILPTNQSQQQDADAQPSASNTVVTPLTPIFDGVTAVESGDDEVIAPEGRRLRKRGRCYQSPYVEFPLKKKKAAFDPFEPADAALVRAFNYWYHDDTGANDSVRCAMQRQSRSFFRDLIGRQTYLDSEVTFFHLLF